MPQQRARQAIGRGGSGREGEFDDCRRTVNKPSNYRHGQHSDKPSDYRHGQHSDKPSSRISEPDELARTESASRTAVELNLGSRSTAAPTGDTAIALAFDLYMMQPMKLRGWLPLLLLTASMPATAEPSKTLAGRWSASTLRTNWSADPWGDACGPRPVGASVPGGIVTIVVRGSELVIEGLGRNYSTTSCWEVIAGQRVTSHSGQERNWRSVCQSAAGDPRRATVTTTISATDSQIDLNETGQFEFVIEGQTCRAAMRRSRSYSLVEREGESRPVPAPVTPPPAPIADAAHAAVATPKTEERQTANCAEPGPPARLEVRPTRKLLRAGDEYTFHVHVFDRVGCILDRPLLWKVATSTTNLELSPMGVIHVAKDAGEGSATLTASVQERSVQLTVDVVSETRYQELLLAGNFDDHGETRDSAVVSIASTNVGTKAAVLEEKARSRRMIFVGIVGLIALGLAGAATWMAFGRRRQRSSADPDAEARSGSGLPRATGIPSNDSLVCPTCQAEYPGETKFCAIDGNRLVPLSATGRVEAGEGGVCPVCGQGFDPGVTVCPIHDEELVPPMVLAGRQSAPTRSPRRICPVCGTVYGTEHQFCGNDGAALVPIN